MHNLHPCRHVVGDVHYLPTEFLDMRDQLIQTLNLEDDLGALHSGSSLRSIAIIRRQRSRAIPTTKIDPVRRLGRDFKA